MITKCHGQAFFKPWGMVTVPYMHPQITLGQVLLKGRNQPKSIWLQSPQCLGPISAARSQTLMRAEAQRIHMDKKCGGLPNCLVLGIRHIQLWDVPQGHGRLNEQRNFIKSINFANLACARYSGHLFSRLGRFKTPNYQIWKFAYYMKEKTQYSSIGLILCIWG